MICILSVLPARCDELFWSTKVALPEAQVPICLVVFRAWFPVWECYCFSQTWKNDYLKRHRGGNNSLKTLVDLHLPCAFQKFWHLDLLGCKPPFMVTMVTMVIDGFFRDQDRLERLQMAWWWRPWLGRLVSINGLFQGQKNHGGSIIDWSLILYLLNPATVHYFFSWL